MDSEPEDPKTPHALEENLREETRQLIKDFADKGRGAEDSDGIQNFEAWAAHIVTGEANKHRVRGIDD